MKRDTLFTVTMLLMFTVFAVIALLYAPWLNGHGLVR